MKYIDKEKLIKDITDHVSCPLEIMNIIRSQEEIEVEPVIHSFWQLYTTKFTSAGSIYPDDCEEDGWRCHNCKKYPDHDDYIANDTDPPHLEICPNCGAKMDMTKEQIKQKLNEEAKLFQEFLDSL